MRDVTPATDDGAPQPANIHPEFRNGSLTAVSVLVLLHHAVTLIVIGTGLQIWALASMLLISSLVAEKYNRAILLFLTGLASVALGVAAAIFAELTGFGQNILGG
jgi:hypothetical protein